MVDYHQGIPEQFRATKEELDAYRKKVVQYLTSMCMVKEMYSKGIIDKADYAICEAKMAEKYGISAKDTCRKSNPDDPKSFIPLTDK
jgi:hypothetical protein